MLTASADGFATKTVISPGNSEGSKGAATIPCWKTWASHSAGGKINPSKPFPKAHPALLAAALSR